MSELEFNTVKLKNFIKKISKKLSSFNEKLDLEVYGVTNSKGIVITGKKVSDNLENYIVVEGKKFVYNPYRINVGSIGISKNDFKGLVSPAYEVFEVDETKLNAEFLYHYLKSPIGSYLINLYGNRGSVRSALRFKDLGEIDIPDLSIEKQNKALKYFKKINEEIQILLEKIDAQLLLLKKLRERILQEAVSGELVEQNPQDEPASILLEKIKKEKEELIKEKKIKKDKPLREIGEEEIPYQLPKNWEWVKLGEICNNIHYGFNASANYNNLNVRLLRITDIQNNKVNWEEVPGCDIKDSDIITYKLNENDILIARTGGTIGKTFIVKNLSVISVFASYLIRAIPSTYINANYIKKFMESTLYWTQLKDNSMGSGQPNVNGTALKNLELPLPPLEEQKRIVEKVDTLMQYGDELEEEINNSKKQSQQLMQSVLREAFKEE